MSVVVDKSKFQNMRLSEIAKINPTSAKGLSEDTVVSFIPMSALDEASGTVNASQTRLFRDVAKGFTPFQEKDILFAKITPCMENGKVAIARGLHGGLGVGSTEFHVLRVNLDQAIPEWIYYFLRREKVRLAAKARMTGSVGQQRVPKDFLENLSIPVPPVSVQKKISAILERADKARRKRQEANRLTDQFLQSAFLEMFGDPVTNPKRWEMKKFGDYINFVTSGSRGWARYYAESGAKFIRVQNLTNHKLKHNDLAFVNPPVSSETERTRVQPNDVLISITGVVGLSAAVPQDIGDAYISQHVALVRLKGNLNPIFSSYYISNRMGGQLQFKKIQYGQTKPGLNLNQIRDVRIYIPPLAVQETFAALVEKAGDSREKQRRSSQELEALFQSLMQRVFKGELVL